MRTTPGEVREIIETSIEDAQIHSYIKTANVWVNNILTSENLDSDTLAEIEKWLTAHLISISRERQTIREEVDGARVDYAGSFGKLLEQTSYGQTVKTLDPTGKMAKAGLKQAKLWAIKTNYDGYE